MKGKTTTLELVCPAGTPPALRAAVDAGADSVYVGFRDETNARNFPGLNFSHGELEDALVYAHGHGAKVLVAINTFPGAGNPGPWHGAVDAAADLGADAIIVADIGLANYARRTHPGLRRHLSVQAAASSPDAIGFYHRELGIKRVVLPRVLTIDEIAALNKAVPVETEVFVFGAMSVMAEGRCAMSSYLTGKSPNTVGVCSPASHVRYVDTGDKLLTTLGGYTINAFSETESACYPTLCKGRFVARGKASYLFEEPTSLNAIGILPELMAAGVTGLKIEGRQRGRAYVAEVVGAFRRAVDAAVRGEPAPPTDLVAMTEGGCYSAGAYRKAWY